LTPEEEKQVAIDLFNGTWELLEKSDRTADDDAAMVHMAHASTHHWSVVGTPVNAVRGEWQVSRVYAVLGRTEPALFHATRALRMCEANGIGDFDLAFCYEALARGHAVGGAADESRVWLDRARAACEQIAEDDDRAMVLADLETI
jgi:hypothetical protein